MILVPINNRFEKVLRGGPIGGTRPEELKAYAQKRIKALHKHRLKLYSEMEDLKTRYRHLGVEQNVYRLLVP